MRIETRFNGPPTSGNGGWSAGTFARAAGAVAGGPPFEVTLRMPPPLDAELVESSVYAADGRRLATGRATWIAVN